MQIGVESSRAVENKRIFVVDNDEIIRSALQFMLHDENETHELQSLEHAYAKAVDWRPDPPALGIGVVHGMGARRFGRHRRPGFPVPRSLLVADSRRRPACPRLPQGRRSRLAGEAANHRRTVRYKVDVLLGRRKLPMLSLDLLQPL
ncbi:MAG: hypothetical protein M5U16_02120 [Hyphomicrobium sp.]|nr:hypothetical protein [Hyphomicrobium sp.]